MNINKVTAIDKKNRQVKLAGKRATARKIKIALLNADVRQVDIARRCGCSRAAVAMVVNGVIRSDRIEDALTSTTGLNLNRLFPPRKSA